MIQAVITSEVDPVTFDQAVLWGSLLTDALSKTGLPSCQIRQIFEKQGPALINEFVYSLYNQVGIFTRKVTVHRSFTFEQAIASTGHTLLEYEAGEDAVVASIPHEEGEVVDLVFFNPSIYKGIIKDETEFHSPLSGKQILEEYEFLGLKPDPFAHIAMHQMDPSFSDTFESLSVWKKDSVQSNLNVLVFGGKVLHENLEVFVESGRNYFFSSNWFVGVRK